MKNFRAQRPVLFCLLAIGVFLTAMLLEGILSLTLSGDSQSLLPSVLSELGEAVLMLILLLSGGLGYVLKRQGNGFGSGIMAGAYFMVIGLLALGSGWALQQYQQEYQMMGISTEEQHLLSLGHIILFCLLMVLVGIAEEFLYRGIVAETLIQHFGSTRKGILQATLITSALFGLTHMVNAKSTGLLSAFVQAIAASVLGIVLTLAYYISGNLWSVVFLHFFVDFSGMAFSGGIYGTGSLTDLIVSMKYTWMNLIGVLPYLIVILVLIRRRNILLIQRVYPLEQN